MFVHVLCVHVLHTPCNVLLILRNIVHMVRTQTLQTLHNIIATILSILRCCDVCMHGLPIILVVITLASCMQLARVITTKIIIRGSLV